MDNDNTNSATPASDAPAATPQSTIDELKEFLKTLLKVGSAAEGAATAAGTPPPSPVPALPPTYTERHNAEFAKYVIGGADRAGRKITAIYATGDAYIIYSTGEDNRVQDMHLNVESPNEADKTPEQRYQEIKPELDLVRSRARHCHDSDFTARVAYAVAAAINGDVPKAKEMLLRLADEMARDAKGRMWYILGAISVAAVVGLIAAIAYFLRATPFVTHNVTAYHLLLVVAFATLGGIISVSVKLKDIDVISDFGMHLFFAHGALRNVYSIAGAAFIYVVVKCNLFFGFVSTLNDALAGLCALGVVAGFSETFVPNTLADTENKAKSEATKSG